MANQDLHSASGIVDALESSQGFSAIFERLLKVDVDAATQDERSALIEALQKRSSTSCGPLTILGLPPVLQAEILLFSNKRFPGIDRTVYLRATPKQVIRKLTETSKGSDDKTQCERLLANYPFARFARDDWKLYFAQCTIPLPVAKEFLQKDEKSGGFSNAEITDIALRNPKLIDCIPPARLGPSTVVALLISGRAESLWKTYDFAHFQKQHWRDVFLHTNPLELPDACRQYVENRNGDGFCPDELLNMAMSCHALINFLDPNRVPFPIAYQLYQTGRADKLWNSYPFAQLDKSEWKRILNNVNVRIPDMFIDVVKSNRFKTYELCALAVKNERLLPFLVAANLPADDVVYLLLNCDATYVWENYRFSKFSASHWEKLILGLASVIRPRAMAAFNLCKGITEKMATEIIRKNTAYCPYISTSVIPPDVVVDVLIHGKGRCLWNTYDFSRLSNEQWLNLIDGIEGEIPEVCQQFLRNQTFVAEKDRVDNETLNAFLWRHKHLVRYVYESLIAPELAYDLISESPRHELWDRFDFTRFDRIKLIALLKKTIRKGDWPDSLKRCLCEQGSPLGFGDILEIATANVAIVVELISYEWINKIDENQFSQFVAIISRGQKGVAALKKRMKSGDGSWQNLSMLKLKAILKVEPALRTYVEWNKWPFKDVEDLAVCSSVFESEVAHPNLYFLWKRWKSLLVLAGLTIGVIFLLCLQHQQLELQRLNKDRWNVIVDKISRYDRDCQYAGLDRFIKSIPAADMAVVSNDLLVVNAQGNLNAWECLQRKNDGLISRLLDIVDSGFPEGCQSEVEHLLNELDESNAGSGVRKDDYLRIRDKCNEFIRDRARKAAVEKAREKLLSIKRECLAVDSVAEVEMLGASAHEAQAYPELATDVAAVETLIRDRIQNIRHAEVMREVESVSNEVASVAMLLQAEGAYNSISSIRKKYQGIVNMPHFVDYKSAGSGRYEALGASLALFEDLMRGVVVKESEADRLKRKFAQELLTVDGAEECSNVVAVCDSRIQQAKEGGGLTDAIKAYELIRKKIRSLEERNQRAWGLIEKLNITRDYGEYLRIRQELLKDFSACSQLRSFVKLNVVSLEDSQKEHAIPSSFWSSRKSVRYRFVGVLQLIPDEPKKILVSVDKSKISENAELYCLTRTGYSSYASVTAKQLIQLSEGKYYRVDNVSCDGYQGIPLFAKDDQYVEGR